MYSVAYSLDGKRITSASSDFSLWLWDASTGAVVGMLVDGHTLPVLAVSYSPDGHHIVTGSGDYTV